MEKCAHCGMMHGPICPQVKAIEYYPDGKLKRVEFKCAGDYATPTAPGVGWFPHKPPVTFTAGRIAGDSRFQGAVGYQNFVGPRDPSNMTVAH